MKNSRREPTSKSSGPKNADVGRKRGREKTQPVVRLRIKTRSRLAYRGAVRDGWGVVEMAWKPLRAEGGQSLGPLMDEAPA